MEAKQCITTCQGLKQECEASGIGGEFGMPRSWPFLSFKSSEQMNSALSPALGSQCLSC